MGYDFKLANYVLEQQAAKVIKSANKVVGRKKDHFAGKGHVRTLTFVANMVFCSLKASAQWALRELYQKKEINSLQIFSKKNSFMKHILVTTDFSIASRNAGEYAVALSEAFGAKITLVHVFAPPLVIDDISAASLLVSHDELVESYQNSLESEIKVISQKHSVAMDTILREGFADDKIPKIAQKIHADVIIMGMKGKGMSHSVFGSTATSVIRKTTLPVLLIPERATYVSIKNITLATDFDSESEISYHSILHELATKYNSLFSILNVQRKEGKMELDQVIGKIRTSLDFSKLKPVYHTISDTNVVHGISRFIKENPTDVLVMIAHRHSFLERVFGVVHTKEMSYHTEIPLLVFHG